MSIEKKKEIFLNNNLNKTKGVNNFSKSTKERKNYNNIQNTNSKIISIKKRNNLTNNNRYINLDNNNNNKQEISAIINTMHNLSLKKNKNASTKCLENKDNNAKKDYNKEYNLIKFKNLNIFEPNTLNSDYLIKKYKMTNFSDIKVKKMKSNFDSIILNYKKDNQKLNNIKTKINKKNKIGKKENNSYIFEKSDKIIKRKELKNDLNFNNTNYSKKIQKSSYNNININGINREYFKSFIINKYSRSFVKVPFINDENVKFYKGNKRERKFTKSFENKKFIKTNFKNNMNLKNVFSLKINNQKNKSPTISKKKFLNINNNRYQMTDYYTSFNNSVPPTIKKIKSLNNNKEENINSLERKNSHNILITNININLYNENDNNCYSKKLNTKTEDKNIDFEKIYLLEQNALKILAKINKYLSCDEECFNWISFYLGINFYNQELNMFKKEYNYKKICDYIKLEIICYFLCYDISLNQNFNKASFLLKAIMNILHENFLIIIKYFLHIYKDNNLDNSNELWIDKLKKIIERELKMNFSSQDMNEDSITSIINNSIKNINNYYEMIIDNLYLTKIEKNDYVFPNCLKLKETEINSKNKFNIISLFFSQANKSLDSFTFDNMKLFFYLYLNNQNYENNEKQNKKMNNNKYYLSSVRQRCKYTIMINLDETLLYNDNNKIILRPNLFNFLSKIKIMYEIIAFSFDTKSNIDKALELIENKSKYFDYILYSDQLTINYNEKLIKDIDNLGRDLKNIIVIDSKIHIHKKYKNNLILIKGFFGDISKDINLLKILGYILQNIKNDNFEDDITIRIKKYRNIIKTYLPYNNI